MVHFAQSISVGYSRMNRDGNDICRVGSRLFAIRSCLFCPTDIAVPIVESE